MADTVVEHRSLLIVQLFLRFEHADLTALEHLESLSLEPVLRNTTEAIVDMSGVPIGGNALIGITRLLQPSIGIRTLNLSNCGIGCDAVIMIAEALRNAPHLHTLDLRNNNIQARGVRHLVETLVGTNVLQELLLQHNPIPVIADAYLARLARTRPDLDTRGVSQRALSLDR